MRASDCLLTYCSGNLAVKKNDRFLTSADDTKNDQRSLTFFN